MPYVVTEACIRCRYGECVDVCPQGAFREGPNFLVIDPAACANCGLCDMVCPVAAIVPDYSLAEDQKPFAELNARLARQWPVARNRGPLPEAAHWATVNAKRAYLETALPAGGSGSDPA